MALNLQAQTLADAAKVFLNTALPPTLAMSWLCIVIVSVLMLSLSVYLTHQSVLSSGFCTRSG